MNLQNFKTLGVINRTPNSFSDHGASLNPDFFKTQITTFLNDPTVIIDVGFESTAPMNSPVESVIELERFHDFLNASKEFSFKDRFISFDTYRPQSFRVMAREFKKIHPEALVIFNDVSGVLDSELRSCLEEFRGQKFYYIYTFSHIPERSRVLEHMKFLDDKKDIIEQTSAAFFRAQKWFDDLGMKDQIIYDPGFGFSKTYEQNWKLIDSFNDLSLALIDLKAPVLIGLSKKSFLKKALGPEVSADLAQLERLHHDCIVKIQGSNPGYLPLLFRVHDLDVL